MISVGSSASRVCVRGAEGAGRGPRGVRACGARACVGANRSARPPSRRRRPRRRLRPSGAPRHGIAGSARPAGRYLRLPRPLVYSGDEWAHCSSHSRGAATPRRRPPPAPRSVCFRPPRRPQRRAGGAGSGQRGGGGPPAARSGRGNTPPDPAPTLPRSPTRALRAQPRRPPRGARRRRAESALGL